MEVGCQSLGDQAQGLHVAVGGLGFVVHDVVGHD